MNLTAVATTSLLLPKSIRKYPAPPTLPVFHVDPPDITSLNAYHAAPLVSLLADATKGEGAVLLDIVAVGCSVSPTTTYISVSATNVPSLDAVAFIWK
jgi:hypothetical protein